MKTPETLFSKATIRYIGLSPETTYRRWNSWQNWSPVPPFRETDPETGSWGHMLFIHFLTGTTTAGWDVWGEDDAAWRNCMTVIFTIAIPRAAFSSLSPGQSLTLHQSEDDWRQVLYCSRGRRVPIPERLRKYCDGEDETVVVETPVGRWPGGAYKGLQGWEDVDESFAWRWKGQVRKWYVFSFWKGGRFLMDNADKLEATRFGEEQYQRWAEENATTSQTLPP